MPRDFWPSEGATAVGMEKSLPQSGLPPGIHRTGHIPLFWWHWKVSLEWYTFKLRLRNFQEHEDSVASQRPNALVCLRKLKQRLSKANSWVGCLSHWFADCAQGWSARCAYRRPKLLPGQLPSAGIYSSWTKERELLLGLLLLIWTRRCK